MGLETHFIIAAGEWGRGKMLQWEGVWCDWVGMGKGCGVTEWGWGNGWGVTEWGWVV